MPLRRGLFLATAVWLCLGAAARAVPDMGAQPLLSAHAITELRWMPDSRALAVNTDSALVLVEPAGPRTLISAYGDLSPQKETVVFVDPGGRLRLQRLADESVRDLGLSGALPQWAPSGNRFAFYTDGVCANPGTPAPSCPPAGLAAADLAAADLTPLVPGLDPADNFAWLPNGSGVVYYHRGELGIARLDAATNTVLFQATPFPCPAEAPYRPSVAVAARAPRAAAFLFYDSNGDGAWGRDDAAALWVFDTDTGQGLHSNPRAWFLTPEELAAGLRPDGITWSPDGSILCYVGRDARGFFLMFLPFSGPMPSTVLRMQDMPMLPRWSPDGEAVAFVSLRADATSPTGATAELRLVRISDAPSGPVPGGASQAPPAR